MNSTSLESWKRRARQLKTETYALYLAYRDPRTPWHARLFAALVIGYAFSPIDLIPDFIPGLGYLDDLLLVPLGMLLVVKMIPPAVWAESRARAGEAVAAGKPVSHATAVMIVMIWLAIAAVGGVVMVRVLRK
jgi:uncharacterized membrane protein YkvA (DUF1232 family)